MGNLKKRVFREKWIEMQSWIVLNQIDFQQDKTYKKKLP